MGNCFLHGKGGSAQVKSVQFGTSTQSASQANITLATAVESDNSIVILKPCVVDPTYEYRIKTLVSLTDTTLSLGAGDECQYIVIEFTSSSVKSIQRGTDSGTYTTKTINHSSVNVDKSFVILDSHIYNVSGFYCNLAKITARTETSFTYRGNYYEDGGYITGNISYQVVEFY